MEFIRDKVRQLDKLSKKEKDGSMQPPETANKKDDIIRQLERKIQASNDCLTNTEYGQTFLKVFLSEGRLSRDCPIEIKEQILRAQPNAILRMHNGELPLAKAIKAGDLTDFVEAMIKVLEGQMEDTHTQPLQAGGGGAGEACIAAAFHFNSSDRVLPLSIDLLERLIALADPDLFMVPSNRLLPIQEAVHFNVCRAEPQRVLGLVQKILDKCEECIAHTVDEGAKLKVDPKKELKLRWLPGGWSIYLWHMETHDSVQAWQATSTETSAQPQPTSTSPKERKTNGGIEQGNLENDWRRGMIKQGSADGGGSATGADAAAKDRRGNLQTEKKRGVKDDMKGVAKNYISDNFPKPSPTLTSNRTDTYAEVNNAAEEASKKIRDELTLRYLRWMLASPQNRKHGGADAVQETHGHYREPGSRGIITDVKSFFGKKRNDTEKYRFVLDMQKEYPILGEEKVCTIFGRDTYLSTLQSVVLSKVRIELTPKESQPTRFTDQLYFLRWLRQKKGVKKIIKLTVDDRREPHRDEDIEEAVGGWDDRQGKNEPSRSFDVEILDWRKLDLCPVTISRAAPNVRELHLQWSGSNSVLFGWSDTQCLPKLPLLRKIHIHYEILSASHSRSKANLKTFKSRVEKSREYWKKNKKNAAPGEYGNISVETYDRVVAGSHRHPGAPGNAGEKDPEDMWFKHVRQFVEMVPGLPQGYKQVRVALIDDGVDVFSESLANYGSSFHPGDSFDTSADGPGPEHTSVSGHGTVMAECILRMCPHAIIVPIRLMMNADYSGFTPRPEPLSAAQAVQLAIEADVDIVSMSWTIPSNGPEEERTEALKSVVNDARRKKLKIPLMFCSAADDGPVSGEQGRSYPREMDREIIVIGAARSDTGQMWSMVSSNKQNNVHFGVPGVEIESVVTGRMESAKRTALTSEHQKGRTGSSIATALAAGLAALLIHCMQLGEHYTKEMDDKGQRADDVLRPNPLSKHNLRTFGAMRAALEKLCLKTSSGDSFVNPKERFQEAREGLEQYHDPEGVRREMPGSLAPIATMIRSLIG